MTKIEEIKSEMAFVTGHTDFIITSAGKVNIVASFQYLLDKIDATKRNLVWMKNIHPDQYESLIEGLS